MGLRYFKVIKEYLTSNTFIEDGFKYNFIDIYQEQGVVYIIVEVILPNPKQSWVASKFNADISEILYGLQRLIGEGFSVSYKTTVDGRDVEEYGYCYVSPEKQEEILDGLNSEIQHYHILKKGQRLDCNLFWKKSKHKFYNLDGDYFGFYFYLNVSNFKLFSQNVRPNMEMIDEIAGFLNEEMMDSDWLRNVVENIIYQVLEPEIKIRNVDECYIQMYTYIDKIDGYRTTPKFNHMDIDPEMFISL